jgi:type IV secretion system protein VirB10
MTDENEKLALDYEEEDLRESFDEDDEEFGVPNENKAKQFNTGNILMILMIAIFVIIGTIVLVSNVTKRKKVESAELDKAGSKYIPNIELSEKEIPFDFDDDDVLLAETSSSAKTNKQNIDDILNDLPEEFQQPEPGIAPVAVVGSSSLTSTRPDTRNSKSTRKIEGLAGQEYTDTSSNTGYSNYGQVSKDDYVANILSQSSKATQSMYGNYAQQNQDAVMQSNRENFYNNAKTTVGQGQFLSTYSLWDGTVITGALETNINTDNPGQIIARVTENVYSSYDSTFLLIPAGTLLFADYNSNVSYGQNRVQIAWNLLIRPDGYRLELGNMNGVDAQGASGLKGNVNNHPFQTLKALGLVAMFSIIQTEVNSTINAQSNEYIQNSLTDLYTEASKLGYNIVERALDIKPTITAKQGDEIKIITNAPLELPPVKVNQVNRPYVRTR